LRWRFAWAGSGKATLHRSCMHPYFVLLSFVEPPANHRARSHDGSTLRCFRRERGSSQLKPSRRSLQAPARGELVSIQASVQIQRMAGVLRRPIRRRPVECAGLLRSALRGALRRGWLRVASSGYAQLTVANRQGDRRLDFLTVSGWRAGKAVGLDQSERGFVPNGDSTPLGL
jgi:hypothetical protein